MDLLAYKRLMELAERPLKLLSLNGLQAEDGLKMSEEAAPTNDCPIGDDNCPTCRERKNEAAIWWDDYVREPVTDKERDAILRDMGF